MTKCLNIQTESGLESIFENYQKWVEVLNRTKADIRELEELWAHNDF